MNTLTIPLSLDESITKALRLSANGDPRPRTVQVYKDGLRLFVAWCGEAGVDPMTAQLPSILAYRDYLLGKGFKRSTVQIRLACAKKLYKALQQWGVRKDDPSAGVGAPKTKEAASSNVLGRALPLDAAKAILALPGPTPLGLRDRAMLTLMLTHGLRAGEISRIAICDIEGSTLRVNGKGGKPRNIVLTAEALAAVLAVPARPDGLLFGVGVRQVERIVDGYLARVGAKTPGRSAHSLRHFFAITATLCGAKIEVLAESMGHASTNTTSIYTRAAAQFQENPSELVAAMLREK